MDSPLHRWPRLLAPLCFTVALGSCGGTVDEVETARSVLLITVDTLRADALGFAGNSRVETPTLDRLAAGGRIFEDAHAHSTVTLPSHANILTGLYPYRHGVRDNLGFSLSADQVTLAERLKVEGFATAGVVAAVPLIAETGLDQGFDLYDDRLPTGSPDNPFLMEQRRGDEVVSAALEWWQSKAGQRRFLWVHLFEPHAPYQPPEPLATEYREKPYLGEVAAVDSYLTPLIDPLLSATGKRDTLVVFTSDHGESLGEHGEVTHGFFAYESTLKIPLVVWGPRVEPGRDTRSARHVDIVATILDAVGVVDDMDTDGQSLLAASNDGIWPDTYFESLTANLTRGWAPLRGLIQNRQKAIDLPVPELYDLVRDPGEGENLVPDQRDRYRSLVAALPDESTLQADRSAVSAEVERRLEALGYLGGSAQGKSSYGVEDDLKSLVHLDRKLMRTHMLFTKGEFGKAAAIAVSILEERSDLSTAREYLAFSLLHLGRTQDAVTVMLEAQRTGTAQPALVRQLALTLTRLGRGEEAVSLLDELIADEEGSDTLTLNALALALIGAGRAEEAISKAEIVLADESANVVAYENLALASQALGRWEDAREYGLKATEIDGRRADSWSNLGVTFTNLGETSAALDAWTQAIEIQPDHVDALFNLGVTAADLGQMDRAEAALSRFVEVAPPAGYEKEIQVARQTLEKIAG
jgi:arylsulfatase A-like enzyme/Flp pilus assembly protein TadD